MLCWLFAICMTAAVGMVILLSYMTNDFQKTMVEHDYGTAGYLVNHPGTNVAAAFTNRYQANIEPQNGFKGCRNWA